jgi:hypothetical protein
MKIDYEDEYGNKIYWNSEEDLIPPSPGDTVIIEGEEWVVRSRIFIPKEATIVIIVADSLTRNRLQSSSGTGRLNEMQNAILGLNKRQDANDKKSRSLKEQIGSVRRNVNQRDRRETNERKDI